MEARYVMLVACSPRLLIGTDGRFFCHPKTREDSDGRIFELRKWLVGLSKSAISLMSILPRCQSKIPTINRSTPSPEYLAPISALGYPPTDQAFVDTFIENLAQSVKRRVENIPPPRKECALFDSA